MMKYLFCFFLLSFCVHLAGNAISSQGKISGNGIASFTNPLEDIREFTVFLPGRSNKPEKKFFIQELEKIGIVKIFSMSKAPINYEGMGTGMILTLGISKLDVLGNPDSETMEINLTLNTSVEVLKTKHPCDAYIWETNVFVVKDDIMDGVKKILNPFTSFYKEANPNLKPIFYVYF